MHDKIQRIYQGNNDQHFFLVSEKSEREEEEMITSFQPHQAD
jgi:hypothetical protein